MYVRMTIYLYRVGPLLDICIYIYINMEISIYLYTYIYSGWSRKAEGRRSGVAEKREN